MSTGTSATASASPRPSRGCDRRSCCTWRPSRSCAARSATPSTRTPPTSWAPSTCSTPYAAPARRPGRVVVSSDKCYENREWAWGYRETDPMGGHDPYSSSKGAPSWSTAAYRASFFAAADAPAVASARAGNVFGGGDWGEDRLLPDIFRAALADGPVAHPQPGGDPPVAARAQPAERLPAPRRACLGRPPVRRRLQLRPRRRRRTAGGLDRRAPRRAVGRRAALGG